MSPELYGVNDPLPEGLDSEPEAEVPVGPMEDPTTADPDEDADAEDDDGPA